MEHPHAELTRQMTAAIVSADIQAMRQVFAPDVVWHVGGRGPLAADHRGFDAVVGMFARMYDMAEGTLSYDVHDVLADDEHTVALLTMRANIADRDIEDNVVHVCHVRDGRISEVWAYTWAQRAIDDAMIEVNVRAAR
jgi:ketosteroid isomerase-like protein